MSTDVQAWVKTIPDDLLERLVRALDHGGMIGDSDIHRLGTLELWDRKATAATAWPRETVKGFSYEVIRYCSNASGPDDPLHRPTRCLGTQYECTCGASDRDGLGHPSGISERQRTPGPGPSWYLHYDVWLACKHWTGPADLDHAVSSAFVENDDPLHKRSLFICVCGSQFYGDEAYKRATDWELGKRGPR